TPALNINAPELPIPNLPKPEISGRLNFSAQNAKISRAIELLNLDAQTYRRNGDFSLAESVLNQALQLDPAHVSTLVSMAQLQEIMGNTETALRYWNTLLAQGVNAGKNLQLARERVAIIQPMVQLEQQVRQREIQLLTLRRQLVIAAVNAVPPTLTVNTVAVQVDFFIKRADSQLQIDPGKMRIQLFFYDQRPGDHFIPAKKIDVAFARQPADWSQSDTEVLQARYTLSRGDDGGRLPYGYLLRVYYNGELQDERADPPGLLKVFPSE
ncbi:MAG: hypothetical protein LBD30_01105, partial [Verrucomicrobiales bacterium]|nr:hypothetical protein [Verrucomicrobiales bacterium]